jgi:hypothetical protein
LFHHAPQNMRTHFKLEYIANRWLDKAEGDCKIQITVPNDWGKVGGRARRRLARERVC